MARGDGILSCFPPVIFFFYPDIDTIIPVRADCANLPIANLRIIMRCFSTETVIPSNLLPFFSFDMTPVIW